MAQLGQNETFLCKAGAGSTLTILGSQEGATGHLDYTELQGQHGGTLPSTVVPEV